MNRTELERILGITIDIDAIDRVNDEFMEGARKFTNWLAVFAISTAIFRIIIPVLLK